MNDNYNAFSVVLLYYPLKRGEAFNNINILDAAT